MRVRYTDFVDVDIDANVQFQEFEYLTDQTIPDEWFSYAWNVFKDGVDWSRSGCDFNKDEDKSEKWTKLITITSTISLRQEHYPNDFSNTGDQSSQIFS